MEERLGIRIAVGEGRCLSPIVRNVNALFLNIGSAGLKMWVDCGCCIVDGRWPDLKSVDELFPLKTTKL